MELLAVKDLSFTYAGAEEPALRGISFSLNAGEFALLTGETGCGKSTLLRLIKKELAPQGVRKGRILFQSRETEALRPRESAAGIGYVFQRPEEQIVTDRVWHELAFGLENLGVPEGEMRRRVAESAQFFGLEESFDLRPDQLSGGKKQLLNLAAATVMEPELLLLDEPTARLDPIAAKNFLSAVERLNRETGMTILMAEHRLEDSLSRAGRLILMEKGGILDQGVPREACARMARGSALEGALPAATRVWRACAMEGACPLNTGEGRVWVARHASAGTDGSLSARSDGLRGVLPDAAPDMPSDGLHGGSSNVVSGARSDGLRAPWKKRENGERTDASPDAASAAETRRQRKSETVPALSFREVWFRFEREGRDILRSLSLRVEAGEIFALLGGNGSGKTTLLRAAAGLIPPYSGEIRVFGKRWKDARRGELRREGVAMLPQDVQALFLRATVREELKDSGVTPEELPFDLAPLANRHPYDLSGGEQQLLGLAKALAGKPRMLLLDEPTGGLDAAWRERIRKLLRTLRERGMTVLMVTHDAEFAAETADRCGLLFRGSVEAAEEPHGFFAGGSYYTTPVSRMIPGCVTVEEAAERLGRRSGG